MADENTEQLRELAEVARRAADEMQRYGSVSRGTMDEMSRLQQSTARLITGTNSLAGAFGRAGTSVDNAANRFEQAGRKFGGAAADGADAVGSMAAAMLQGQKGATAFNQSIALAGRSLQGVIGGLSTMIPKLAGVATVAAIAVEGLAKLGKAATQQADSLYTAFSALTKSGGSAADGMSGVFETAKSLGLSMNELSALTDAVGQRAGEFALFGGTVFDARKRLGQMGDALRGSREQFLSLGMTLPDVTEGLANYIALQGRLGRGQTRTTEQLAVSARKYLLEQDALTRTLGVTRQQQEQAQQRALVDQQFRAKIQMLRDAGQEEAADRLLQLVTRAAAVGDDVAEGVAAAAAGIYTNENAVKLLMSTMGGLDTVIQDVTTGAQSVDQGFGRLVSDISTFSKSAGTMAALVGTNNETFIRYDSQMRAGIIQQHGFEEAMRRSREEQEKMAPAGGRAQDEMTANQARLMEIQARANETLDRFVKEAIEPTQKALISFADNAAKGAEAVRKYLFDDYTPALQQNTEALDRATEAYEKAKQADRDAGRGFGSDATDAAAAEVNRLQKERNALRLGIRDLQQAPAAPAPPDADKDAAAAAKNREEKESMRQRFGLRDIRQPGIDLAPPAPAAATPVTPQRGFEDITEEQLQQMGLKIKPGYTQAPGRGIQQNTVDLAKKVQDAIPGFVRFTGFNDAYPRGEAGASRHPRGAAFDFTLDQHPSIDQGRELVRTLRNMGASNALDEYNNRTDRTTAGHIHVEVPLMAKGGITDGVSIAGEAGPEAVVPLPDGRAIPVELALGNMAQDFAREAATNFVKDAVPGFRELESMKAAAARPSASTIADVVSLLNPAVGGHMKQAAALHDAATQESTEMDRLLDVISIVVPKFGLLRSAFQRIESLMPDDTMTAAMPQAEIGSRISTADIGSEIGERVKDVVAGTTAGTTETLQQIQREFTNNLREVVQRMDQQQNPQLQQEMLAVLNSINRNQGRTADASQRMADVAMN